MFAGSCGHEQNQSGFNHGERVKEEAMALLTYFLLLLLVCEEPESLFFFFCFSEVHWNLKRDATCCTIVSEQTSVLKSLQDHCFQL